MRFPENSTVPRVITFGNPGTPLPPRRALVPYTDDPGTGLRWVAMDQRFIDDLIPAMLQQHVAVQWIEDPDYLQALRELAQALNIEMAAGAGAILRAAVTRITEGS